MKALDQDLYGIPTDNAEFEGMRKEHGHTPRKTKNIKLIPYPALMTNSFITKIRINQMTFIHDPTLT